MALDCGFQLATYWCDRHCRRPSLPTGLGEFLQARSFPNENVQVKVRVRERKEHRIVADMDWYDQAGELLATLRGFEAVMDASLTAAFVRNQLEAVTLSV